MDMFDTIITKIEPENLKVYEDKLADKKLKSVVKKLISQFNDLKKLNKMITPTEILKQRKIFRSSVIIRNIYSEVLHIIQAIVMKKISTLRLSAEQKKYLKDSLMTSIAGISAAMKNTG